MKGVGVLLKSILIYVMFDMLAFACFCIYGVIEIVMGMPEPMILREPTIQESKIFFAIFLLPISIFIIWAGILGIIEFTKKLKGR